MIGTLTPGRRVTSLAADEYHLLEPGEYMRGVGGWVGHCPGVDNLLANFASHQITEHEDGTITVAPSILCGDGTAGHTWHGYLERGVWREA